MQSASPLRTPKRKLYPHQIEALKYCCSVQHPALFLEMRLGKTLVVVRDLVRLHPQNSQHFLVVAPGSALAAWEKELRLEGETDVILLLGPRLDRYSKMAGHNHKWNLINKEGFLIIPELAKQEWDAIIIDESTTIKSPQTQISRFFSENFRGVPRRYILSGRPNPESNLDLFQQFKFLTGQMMGFDNFWKHRATYYTLVDHQWVALIKNRRIIRDWVKANAFVLRRKDVRGAHVGKVYEYRTLTLPKHVRRAYLTAEREFVLEVGDTYKTTVHAVAKFAWCRQLCGGFANGMPVWIGKLQELRDLLTGELSGEKVVVWFAFNNEIRAAESFLQYDGVVCCKVYGDTPFKERRAIFRKFNKGSIRVVLVQTAVAEFGVDLSEGCDTAIYYSGPVSLSQRIQSEDRIMRLGKKSLLYVDLICENTVDEDVYAMVSEKDANSSVLMRSCARIREGRQ